MPQGTVRHVTSSGHAFFMGLTTIGCESDVMFYVIYSR